MNRADAAELRVTLTHDICDKLPQMTEQDFKDLMEVYRQERTDLQKRRGGEQAKLEQSLWEKLEEKRLATIRSESSLTQVSIQYTINPSPFS